MLKHALDLASRDAGHGKRWQLPFTEEANIGCFHAALWRPPFDFAAKEELIDVVRVRRVTVLIPIIDSEQLGCLNVEPGLLPDFLRDRFAWSFSDVCPASW